MAELEPKTGKRTVLKNNTSEAADLIDRAQSGDTDALMKILNLGHAIFVEDMPGKLVEFDEKKKAKK
ncbi:MAG: hypothetical protein Q8L01_03045 [Candidatus Woesebacteria bacterium]|nr:hypothetical protein [Candidatus Woesebacteria bacterium]